MKHISYPYGKYRRCRRLRQNLMLLALSALIWALGSAYLSFSREERTLAVQQNLAEQVVRFHVLANSDRSDDQALKLLVKNAVLEYMSEPLNHCENAAEALALLDAHTFDIIRVAEQVIEENGYSYSVTAGIEDVYFPVKAYGDVTFPAGIYTAYRILIGEGEGQNWWCVLYPPLCFVDITHGIVPAESKEQLRAVLTDEEYLTITGAEASDSMLLDAGQSPQEVYLRFRILTFLNP